MREIDSEFGFAFLDIEVTFEVVVFRVLRDFSKSTQANGDFGLMEEMGRRNKPGNKPNAGTGEINPANIGHAVEIRRIEKLRVGKIGDVFE